MRHKRDYENHMTNMEKMFKHDLFTDSRLMDSRLLLHFVDDTVLARRMLDTYKQMEAMNGRMIDRNGDDDDLQKARDTRIDSARLENRADYRQIALNENLEKL